MLKTMANQGKDSLPTLQSRVSAYVREIAADYSYLSPWIWEKVLGSYLKRNFSALEFDHEGLDELRVLLRKRRKVILTPSHRSHLDYIFISYAIYKQGLACPLVAAGQNLSFWPMGYFFRKTGAFFIRRTFRGLDIYPLVFRSYLWLILHKFQPVEFFIEGGRSRTGALLPAKLGILNMILDAFNSGKLSDVNFVPIAVNYDRIPEEDSYIRELKGLPKQKERITSLLKSRHLLKRHFGNVCFAVGKPVSLAETSKESTNQAEQKDKLGTSIMNQLRLTMPVTSTALVATVMMALDPDAEIAQNNLISTAQEILLLIKKIHPEAIVAAECSDNSSQPHKAFESAILRMNSFENILPGAQTDTWKLNSQRRLQVDYLRNSIMGLLLAPSLAVIMSENCPNSSHSLNTDNLDKILCPTIHPIPSDVIRSEIQKSKECLPYWSETQCATLKRTVYPLANLVNTIFASTGLEPDETSQWTSRSWNSLFQAAVDTSNSRDYPEICSKAMETQLYKACKQFTNGS